MAVKFVFALSEPINRVRAFALEKCKQGAFAGDAVEGILALLWSQFD